MLGQLYREIRRAGRIPTRHITYIRSSVGHRSNPDHAFEKHRSLLEPYYEVDLTEKSRGPLLEWPLLRATAGVVSKTMLYQSVRVSPLLSYSAPFRRIEFGLRRGSILRPKNKLFYATLELASNDPKRKNVLTMTWEGLNGFDELGADITGNPSESEDSECFTHFDYIEGVTLERKKLNLRYLVPQVAVAIIADSTHYLQSLNDAQKADSLT